MDNRTDAIKTYNDLSHLGNAAGRKRGHIMSNAMAQTSRSFFKKNHFNKSLIGLDLFCGEGKITNELAQVFGQENRVIGFDIDATSIKIAKEKIALKNDQVEFLHLENDNWFKNEAYDFIYCRTFLNQFYTPLDLFQKMYSSLKPNGFVLLESFDLSNFQCFPQNYAFDRYLELHTALNRVKGTSIKSAVQLGTSFHMAQFKKNHIQIVSPAFLPDDCKQIASLSLESIATELLEMELTNQTELQALLFELKTFEKQKNTMISLPGIYQAVGYK